MIMGDDIRLKDVQIVQGGELQVDLWNNTTRQNIRFFCKPEDILKALGRHFSSGRKKFLKDFEKKHGGNLC